MNRRELFEQMLEAAGRVYDRVELNTGDFRGGVCRVRDERCLFINRAASLDHNLKVLANHLAGNVAEGVYLLPKVREAIERYSESEERRS